MLEYIAKRAKQNIRQLEGALLAVKAASEQEDGRKLDISVDLAKDALDFMSQSEEKEITIDSIKDAVAKYFNITVAVSYTHLSASFINEKGTIVLSPSCTAIFDVSMLRRWTLAGVPVFILRKSMPFSFKDADR